MAPSAKGVEIRKGSKAKWRIGKILGSGACATVHSLETIDGNPTDFAAKVVPLPTKKTKKQNSKEEIDARLLHFEHLIYSNIIPDLRGTYVPRFPSFGKNEPPSQGEVGGFKFMILEKMDCELSDIVPVLLRAKGTSIDFGPIAVKLLECIQAIQEHMQVVVDIKAENFMLTCDKGKGSTESQKLASRTRLLDVALLKPWIGIGDHKANEGTSGIAGTPLYASINVHNGETPSRRDDFEAIGYVIAELVMKLVAGDPSIELPWSNGNSDEAIGRMKEENMSNPNSAFFQQLGSKAVVKIISEYMDEVRGYTFKKTPDYASLKDIVSKLKIPKSGKAPAPATKTRAAKTKTPASASKPTTSSRRRTRAQKRASPSSDDEDEVQIVESPAKMARDENSMETDMEEIVIDCSQEWTDAQPLPRYETPRGDNDDESFGTATMDWEATADENEEPKKPAAKSTAPVGVTVLIDAGPHKGRSFNMIKGQTDKFLIGRNPSSTTGETAFALSNDDKVDGSHIRMELAMTKKLVAVRVYDLKSDSGTFVGSDKVRSGKDYRIFTGQSVRIGESVLTVKKLDPSATKEVSKSAASNGRATRSARTTRASRSSRSTPESDEVIELRPPSAGSNQKAGLKRRGIQLVVIDGPHKGESYAMESGGNETLIIGQNPTSSVGTVIRLKRDKSLKATHLRVDLTVAKKLVTVSITDKSKGGTVVNHKAVNKGRAFINDRIKIGDSVLDIQSL